jgi:hypothetical protein
MSKPIRQVPDHRPPETRPILTLTVLIVRPCTFTDSALAAWQPAVEPAEKALYIQLVSEIPL